MRYVLILILLFINQIAFSQSRFYLNGKIKGFESGWIYLAYEKDFEKKVNDSSWVNEKGEFKFSGEIGEPIKAKIFLKKLMSVSNPFQFFLEPSKMEIVLDTGDLNKATVRGSKAQYEYLNFLNQTSSIEKLERPFNILYDSLDNIISQAYKMKDTSLAKECKRRMENIRIVYDSFNAKVLVIHQKYYEAHPRSYITAYSLRYEARSLDLKTLNKYYENLGPKIKGSYYGRLVELEINKLKGGWPGTMSKNFRTVDINGDTIELKQYRGTKYVLLDFWASWCVPCRKGNPRLKELYQVYNSKGLEIIGVSDNDLTIDYWKKAVVEDKLPWPQILRGAVGKDGKMSPSGKDINLSFGIQTLPTKILIDKNGVIVGRYLEEDDNKLEAKLKEIFKQ
jgi:thiol-disulfide isomerase/thioredoxin